MKNKGIQLPGHLDNTCHAADNWGKTRCGDQTPGTWRENVENYPTHWVRVTCATCLTTKEN